LSASPTRESAYDWRELLLDLKRRGLDVRPELAIDDGALGFWKAASEIWITTREQRCWVDCRRISDGIGTAIRNRSQLQCS
jgi:transposase-like protein